MKCGKMTVYSVKISDRVNVHLCELNEKNAYDNGDERSRDLVGDLRPYDKYEKAYGTYKECVRIEC